MGIPINWEQDEELISLSSQCGPAVIHHHHDTPSTSSPRTSTTPPVLPPRHPQRRLTQHYQALRQHYADQPAIHRQSSMTLTPPSPPQMQVQHQNQQQQPERHVPASTALSPAPVTSVPDQSQTTRQTQQQRLQRQQQRRSSPSASALFRYYQQQQQQQQQQQEPPQQLAPPVRIHSIAVRPRGDDSAADTASQSQASASPATLTTAPEQPSPPLPAQSRRRHAQEVADMKKEERKESTEAERLRAYRQAAEHERRKMALEREQLWRRCQQRSSSPSTTTNGANTGNQPLRRSGQERSNRAPSTSESVSSTTLPKYDDTSRTTSVAARAIERAQQQQRDSGSDSGVDMQSSGEEEDEQDKERVSQAPATSSLVAGRHHHRSFYAMGPHRAPQIRSAIPAWPSSPNLTTYSANTSASTTAAVPTTLPTDHVPASGTATSTSFTTNNTSNIQGLSVSHRQAAANSGAIPTAPIFTSSVPFSASALLPSMVSENQPRVPLGEHVNNAAATPLLSVQHPSPPTAAAAAAATLPRQTTPPSVSTPTSHIILPASVSTPDPALAPIRSAPLLSHSAIIVQFEETTELQGTMQSDAMFREQIQQVLGSTASVSMAMCCLLPEENHDPDLLSKLVQLPIVRHAWKLPPC